ncbi:MAG: hypothetical protein GY868_05710 [Deltaproteobacteria bacterium]|nr:hypothetical protein [Deltaproteobacteria bacterium]
MKVRAKVWTIVIGCSLLAAGFLVDGGFDSGIVVSEAQARIGRPATPGSVAGVARRTTRRRIRRTTRYVATLPKGCTTVVIEGTTLHQCGGTYYQSHSGQYVVVNVD